MKIIFETRSDNPEYNADCDYAVVDMTPALLEQIRRRVELARQFLQQDDDLYELYFWGGTADFYAYSLVESCQDAVAAATVGSEEAKTAAAVAWLAELERNGRALLPGRLDLGTHEIQRTECDQMIIRCPPSPTGPEFEVAWVAVPKHTDIYVTTADLPLAALEAYAHGQTQTSKEVPR